MNNSVPCGIAIKTTGRDPKIHELLEIAIIPMNNRYEPQKDVLPFHFKFKPEADLVFERSNQYDRWKISKEAYLDLLRDGLPAHYLVDCLDEWFHGVLAMPERKRIYPVAYNWPYIYSFLLTWLGWQTCHDYFDERFRDLLSMSLTINDMADLRMDHIPYPDNSFSYVCRCLRVTREVRFSALHDAAYTIEAYRRMIGKGAHYKA
jgi:hypothetical protein